MWPSLPFIDQGGKHLTTWGLFLREPSYPLYVPSLHRAISLASLGFPLVAGNLHDNVLMNELKKHWNNTEFWCTMDEEEPHLCHIHLRTIIDTQLTPGFFYFYEKQEGTIKAHRVAHNLHSWIWTNIPSLEMIGCLNGECSPLTACCAKHQEQLVISHPIP